MGSQFCKNHTLAFFKSWNGSKPLDLSLSDYFRSHKSLGSHDRRWIGETVYSLIRWQSLFDEIDPTGSISLRLHLLEKQPLKEWLLEPRLSQWAKRGSSQFLFERLVAVYGSEEGARIAETLNEQAPIAIRVNTLKSTRAKLLGDWAPRFGATPGRRSDACIYLPKREALFALQEFKDGLFEVQDEGSQLVASLVQAKPGDRVLDYCSGSGGKSLAIAPPMQGKGELYLHDIRSGALTEAKKRLRRAGIQNAQILHSDHPTLSKLRGKMDWVIADVPCSGTGTLRRNPDMKWKIDAPMIARLCDQQRAIAAEAIRFLKPDGKLIYATCSIFPEENEQQVSYILSHFPLELECEPMRLLPESGGCDGFFAAVFRKRKIE